jgi:hypothetical protein
LKDVKTRPLLRWKEELEAMRGHRAQASATGRLDNYSPLQ